MGFAAPIALLFLGLFIPVILLYLLKQRRRRVEVSTLMFWDKILRDEQTVTSITRLKKLLSLFLQLLFIALLTFALARPLLSGKWTGGRRVVLLLDTSASMLVEEEGKKSRFAAAKEKADAVIQGLSFSDTLMLVAVGQEPDVVHPFSDSRKDLRDALDKIEPTHGEGNFPKALKLLDQLGPDQRQTHVYLATDGAFDPVEVPVRTNFFYAFLKVGQATDNIGITSFQVRPLPASPRDFQVHIEVANETDEEQTVPLELRIAGSLVDAYELTIPSHEVVTRSFRQYSAQGGEIEAIVDYRDPFPIDNKAYATVPAPRPIKVALVTTNDLFLEQALLTDDDVELTVLLPQEFPSTNTFEVTIFSGWTPPATPQGNVIFIHYWPADLGLPRKANLEKPMFSDWDREHPINRHLALQNVSIESAVATEKQSEYAILASSFNDPLLLLKESDTNKIMVVTFDPGNSDLPLRIAFPIMIANAIRHLGGVDMGDRWANVQIGSILSAAELDRYAQHSLLETNQIGAVYDPKDTRTDIGAPGALVHVNKAGFYRGGFGGETKIPLFAANVSSRRESRIAPAEKLPLKSSQELAEIKRGLRLGAEPWVLLVLMAMMLSVVEWGLFHRRVIE